MAWKQEQGRLEKEIPELKGEVANTCRDLAFAEVISFNKANLERNEQNEHRRMKRQMEHGNNVQKKKGRGSSL